MQTNSVMRNIVLQVGWVLLNDSKRYIGLCRNEFGYCFKKCVSNKRKKSTDFLDLQEIKTTKTKKV